MSIVPLVEGPSSAPPSLPIATEAVCQQTWLPACTALGLQWVPLFESGLPLTKADRPFVLEELKRFEGWVRSNAADAEPADRAQTLARALAKVTFDSGVSVYIG